MSGLVSRPAWMRESRVKESSTPLTINRPVMENFGDH